MNSSMRKSIAVADISDAAATSVDAFDAPVAGRLNVKGCHVVWDTEATGTQTTQGVISIEVGGVEIATLTAARSGALGDSAVFAVDGTYTTNASPYAEFAAGAVIEVKIKTQAVTGAEGEGSVYLALEYAV